MLAFELNIVWLKKNTETLATETPIRLPFKRATGDYSKQLKPCLYVVQNYRFQFKIVIGGKMDSHRYFIY